MPSPLQHPINCNAPAGTPAPWRDNAFVSFWDPAQEVFGTVHVSTGPSEHGRRARVSLSVRGAVVEVVEPLDAGTFQGASVGFDLESGALSADTPQLAVSLVVTGRLAVADFSSGGVIPKMGAEPLQHFQSAVDVRGTVRVGAETIALDATGIRDRTWGQRDESVAIREYVWLFINFPRFAVTAMRFQADGGSDRTDGFVITDGLTETVTHLSLTRDPAGLCAAATFSTASGKTITARSAGRRGGFWVPMGPERDGPAMSAYDEFGPFETSDGTPGFGLAEHGVVRQLF
jgi:hypothetical protein